MLKNFAEKAIRRDTKHNGRKAPRHMAKTMTPRGFFVCKKGDACCLQDKLILIFKMECDVKKQFDF